MPFITRLPALTGADPYPDALLALDFVGARRGPQYYKALGVTTADITKVPGWTYTGGASAGSYAAKADGSLQLFAQNVPRITDAGYWAEEARTNLLLNTATLSTQSVTVTAVAHTLSFYGTGTVTLTGTSTAGPLVGTGASNRVTLTFTPTAGTLTLTVTGSVTIAQLEAGSFATSPIPTTSVAVTRAADVGYVSGIAIPTTGTMVATANVPTTANDQWLAFASDGTVLNRIFVNAQGANGNGASGVFASGVGNTLTVASVITGAARTVAMAYTAGAQSTTANGANPVAGTVATVPSVTRLDVGGGGAAASTRQAQGAIRRIVIYPRAFGNSESQAITTAGAY